jgi:hypothetical protein
MLGCSCADRARLGVNLGAGRTRKREEEQGSQRKQDSHNEERGRRIERLPREFYQAD